MIDAIEQNLLREVADLDSLPVGAYNIRANGQLAGRNTTANIDIVTKDDKPGIDIYIRPFTKNESVHIPVILSQTGLTDLVYNDFHIGEGADVTIIAGCGIHNCGGGNAQHDGIHTFYLAKNAKLRYVEKHYGEGDGRGKQVMNPTTIVHLAEDTGVSIFKVADVLAVLAERATQFSLTHSQFLSQCAQEDAEAAEAVIEVS